MILIFYVCWYNLYFPIFVQLKYTDTLSKGELGNYQNDQSDQKWI